MITIIGIAIISAVLYTLIKKFSPEFSALVEIGATVIVLLIAYPYLCDIVDFLAISDIDTEYIKLLLKTVGVAILTQFAADICIDSGETALASKIEFAGKSVILALSLPTVKTLLEFAIGLINEK